MHSRINKIYTCEACGDTYQAKMTKPGHDFNITSNNFSSIGIGVFCQKVNGGYVYHFSQMFSPKDF